MIKRLQHVQTCAARLILRAPRFEHTNTLLKQLHWLPIHARILYKHNCLAVPAISFDTPFYLSDVLHLYRPSIHLLSSEDTLILTVPKSNCQTKGDRSFYFVCKSAKSWNALPSDIRQVCVCGCVCVYVGLVLLCIIRYYLKGMYECVYAFVLYCLIVLYCYHVIVLHYVRRLECI